MASHDFPVAVIGMAVKLPGANNCSEFWDLMVNQEDTVSTFPEERAADIEHILPTFKGQNARKQDTGSQKVADSSGQMEASSDSSTRDTSAISKTEIELNEDFNGQGKTKRDNSAISKTEIEVNEDFNGQGKTKSFRSQPPRRLSPIPVDKSQKRQQDNQPSSTRVIGLSDNSDDQIGITVVNEGPPSQADGKRKEKNKRSKKTDNQDKHFIGNNKEGAHL